ncbi:unnamed protein product [Enterobius vermicularis]|uniref:Uncharacterized protein n=1 Tax=Enterobius vermicularis TaxID=51028 RepID=A0A3P6IUH7_ENTVE|nr:unnamed protein product [Enterobius vermicularis]
MDYEDPTQRRGFNIAVRVYDGRHEASTKLRIQLEDVNDNPPECFGPKRKDVSEGADRGTQIGQITCIDRDENDRATYRINRKTDPKRQFSVDEYGNVKIAHTLDREEIPAYNLLIEAFDTGNDSSSVIFFARGNVDSMGVDVVVPCVFMEHVDPTQQQPCEIRAIDRDTMANGPPFYMRLSSNFKYGDYLDVVFDKNGDYGNGSMTIRPKVVFDREQPPGKFLEIPIYLEDKFHLGNERSVFVVIGDINDSEMHDGTTNIYVYSYLGRLGRTVIGRVYVDDLDDWDLNDKQFEWGSGGQITMDGDMPAGQYVLTSSVSDTARGEHAIGTVYVDVIIVPQLAFENQGVLRMLYGLPGGYLSPDVFLRPDSAGSSPMMRFKEKMEGYLGPGVNIQIFSIQPGEANLQTSALKVIDVRFSAFDGSTYRSPVVLNGLITQHRSELESVIGATIVSGGIDMCKYTMCDQGCQTIHLANEVNFACFVKSTILNKVLVLVLFRSKMILFGVVYSPNSCKAGLCRNGGVCHNTPPNGFFCECRTNDLKGFRCQGTTRSFNGNGYAWFKPMPACTSLNISFQFMTSQPNGLLLYNGPMGSNVTAGHLDYKDYLVLRLSGGRLEAELMLDGNATNVAHLDSTAELNDNKWHTVALTQIGKTVELVLDNCAPIGSSIGTDSSCRRVVVTLDDDERLNVITPLQVGGLAPLDGADRYPTAIMSKPYTYSGCIRDLMVNGEKYDLGVPDLADEQNSQRGCSLNTAACISGDGDYCVHGECIADASIPKCTCDPGYSGDRCEQEIEWVEFSGNSLIAYTAAVQLEKKKSEIEVLVYPARNTGNATLGYASGSSSSEYVGTYLNSMVPEGRFDCGNTTTNSSVVVSMENLQLSNNYSYWVQFSRSPVKASLTVDGTYYTGKQLDPLKKPYELQVSEILLGASSSLGGNWFQGCIGTFRWEHQNLPLQQGNGAAGSEEMISIRQSIGVTRGCSSRQTCALLGASYCSPPFICLDFWKGAFCTCPKNLVPVLGPDGTLIRCGEALALSKLGITNNAIIIIMVFLGLLLLMVLLMIVYSRRQAPPFAPVRPVELNRDNIRPYDIEGGGEADNDQYDINGLRKPVMPLEGNGLGGFAQSVYPPQRTAPDDKINTQIKRLEADPDATAPYDELRIFEDEGDDVSR